jgi:acyl-CoA reductase-like NAD-dependent aldehyde dehydrogenase
MGTVRLCFPATILLEAILPETIPETESTDHAVNEAAEVRFLRFVDELETGTVFLNRCDYLDPALAWTGVKDSGRGVTLSKFGYDQVTRAKSVHMKIKTR